MADDDNERRLADLIVSHEVLTHLFGRLDGATTPRLEGLPADARIVAVHNDWARDVFVVRFRSAEFQEVYQGDPIPRINALFEFRTLDETQRLNAEMAAVFSDRVEDSEVARMAVLRERRACAALAEKMNTAECGCDDCVTNVRGPHLDFATPRLIADAIRARGKETGG